MKNQNEQTESGSNFWGFIAEIALAVFLVFSTAFAGIALLKILNIAI